MSRVRGKEEERRRHRPGSARRNVAQAPFHLTSTLFEKYISKYTSRDGASRAQAPVPAVTFFPVAARCLRLGA
jgi:hypothetical protein